MSDNQALDTFDGLDYEEIEQAVMETSRGRWFLTEFARRHKAADTAVLLDAIRRLESQIQSMTAEHGHDAPAQARAPAAGDVSDYDEIADKLDRTTQLVRRLRSSQKLVGDAADKPLPASEAGTAKRYSEKPTASPPGFVASDDDIFADNNSIVSALQQQAEMPDDAAAGNDTMRFADVEETDTDAVRAEAAAEDDAAEQAQQQAEPANPKSQTVAPPLSEDESIKANGRISVTRPTAANQAQAGDEAAAEPEPPEPETADPADTAATAPEPSEPEEKPKKRIVVIRRPADQPGDIPLADSDPATPDDSPTAA